MLLGDNDSSASKVGVNSSSFRAESAVVDAGLLDSLETTVDLITPPPPNLDGWYDINNFP
jgi:hypothetical protein